MVREGFEAALIVALVFGYLRRIGRLDMARAVWLGVLVAALVATGAGVALHLMVGGLTGVARLRSFAAISIVAACVLTWMVFWMRRQAATIRSELEHKIDAAVHAERRLGALAVVAFVAVVREGLEAALFMVAAATGVDAGEVLVGAVIGLTIATALGLIVYAGSRRLPMRSFFQVTGVVVIVFAAGLLARAVLFLQSAGDLGTIDNAVYDVTRFGWLTQSSEIGRFLAAMLGWDPRPSLEQVMVWLVYLVPIIAVFFKEPRVAAVRREPPTVVEAVPPA